MIKSAIISNLFIASCFCLFGQDIPFNIQVSQLMLAATDSTEEIDRNSHYFLFSKNGDLLASQNMQKSTRLPNRKWFENSRIEKHVYKKNSKKKQSEGFYVDTLGNEFNKDLIHYQYKKGKLIGEIISIGVDSIVSLKELEYHDDGRIKKIETRNTQYDFELEQIKFDQFDTIVSQYNWKGDSECHVLESNSVSFDIFMYPDSTIVNQYYEGVIKFELRLNYDTLGRLVSTNSHRYESTYYVGKKNRLEYDKAGGIIALHYSSKFISADLGDDKYRSANPYRITWDLDSSKLTKGAIRKINDSIFSEITPSLEECLKILPTRPKRF